MLPAQSSLLNILFDNDKSIRYLLQYGVFYATLSCPKCNETMTRYEDRGCFRCSARSCRKEVSLRKHTFFYGSTLNCAQIMHLGYQWLNRSSQMQAMNATGHNPNTVTNFYNHFRTLVAATLDIEDQIVGGPGIIVEIDETKLGKRKYNRGHRVEGAWILVGVERTEERRVFLSHVYNRSAATLQAIIAKCVRPGSIIHTDKWKGYCGLSKNLDLEHYTVNHSKTFKDPITQVHTNTVEGTNNGLKIMIRPRNRGPEIDDHLTEFVWRRKHSNNLWKAFIDALKEIHYDTQ